MSRPDNIDAPLTNYVLIQKLSHNFANYITENKIPVPSLLLEQLNGKDPGTKIAWIKEYVVPRIQSLEIFLIDLAKTNGVEITKEKIDKLARYLRAMAEVAMQ